MFLIMGISNGEKKLQYDQLEICRVCGKYGHMEVFMTYTYFMFFFIPIVKWNRHYYVRMNCCGRTYEIEPELGEAIKKGEVQHLNLDSLHFEGDENNVKICSQCGFTTRDEYQYCPKCGNRL